MDKGKSIVLIGAGNLASHLGPALCRSGYKFVQVVSRTIETSTLLAQKLGAIPETSFTNITADADFYLICVSDSQIEMVVRNLNPQNKFLIHTSGSTDMNIFSSFCKRYGVLYPLQTFSKNKEMDLAGVPFFTEASSPKELDSIDRIANSVSEIVQHGSSELRLYLHVCAVFTCSFTNQMYRIAEEICREKEIPFEYLHPLILETAVKAGRISPAMAQTGPVSRNDQLIMKKHIHLLEDHPEFRKIYTFVAASILKMNGHSTEFLNAQPGKDE